MSKILRIQEFAKLVGRTPQTIRRWEKEGKLVAKRLPSGHRYFLESDVQIVRDIPFIVESAVLPKRRTWPLKFGPWKLFAWVQGLPLTTGSKRSAAA